MNDAAPRPAAHAEDRAVPAGLPAPGDLAGAGCRALCFAGPPRRGRDTRVFAWLGLPPAASAERPAPGVVLVHGGTGTAFAEWVRRWTARGYAAIACDYCGAVPVRDGDGGWRRLPDGGPPGWGGFDQVGEPPEYNWNHHAAAAAIRAHSLLRARPAVDSERTALVGISWGGVLACRVAAVDGRFRCAVVVYACGSLDRSPTIGERCRALDPAARTAWLRRWDPDAHLPRAGLPLLFVNGTGDAHFVPPHWDHSTRLPPGPVTRSLQVGMGHGHEQAWASPEIPAFVAAELAGAPPLARLGDAERRDGRLAAGLLASADGLRAELAWSAGTGPWPERSWRLMPAAIEGDRVAAAPPDAATAAFLTTVDGRGLRSSSGLWFAGS